MVDCCPGADAELTLSVLHCHNPHVKIHSVPLLDTIRERYLFLGWAIPALLCSSILARLFPENGLSQEALEGKRCLSSGEGTTPPAPIAASLGPLSPGQEGTRPALCLCVLLFSCKTSSLVTGQEDMRK